MWISRLYHLFMSAYYKCDLCQKETSLEDIVDAGRYSSHLQGQDVCIPCWMNSDNWPRLHTLSINSKYYIAPKFKQLPADVKLVRQVTRYVRQKNSDKTIKFDQAETKI